MSYLLRANDEIINRLKEEAKKQNISINELIINAINHFFICKEKTESKEATLKLIVTKFNGKCTKCNAPIPLASHAYYGHDGTGKTILICLDCMVENKSDKALAARYLKLRELQKTVQALKREAEQYAEKLADPQIITLFQKLYTQNDEICKKVREYLTCPTLTEKENKILDEIATQLEQNKRITQDIEIFIRTRLTFKPTSTKTQQTQEWIRDPNRKIHGMIFCPDKNMWIFQCGDCPKKPTCIRKQLTSN